MKLKKKKQNEDMKVMEKKMEGEVKINTENDVGPIGDDLDEGVRVQELESPNTKRSKMKELQTQESKQKLIQAKLLKLGKPKLVKRSDSSVRGSDTESKISTVRNKTLKKGQSMYNS